MKIFLKKYIELIFGVIMMGLLFLGMKIYPTNPNLSLVFIKITVWYVAIIVGLVLFYLLLKLLNLYVSFLKSEDKLHFNFVTPVILMFFISVIIWPHAIVGLLFIFAVILLGVLLFQESRP